MGDRDGRLLVVDGRLQQLRDRAGRQVHAGRRPRARLPAAARGADARDPQAAPADRLRRPDEGWRERYQAVGTEEVVAVEGRLERRRRLGEGRRVPDATGLELLAQDLRDAQRGQRRSTPSTSAARARSRSRPARSARRCERLREQGLRLPARVHGVDYYPEEPRLGVHYELLDMERARPPDGQAARRRPTRPQRRRR